jgi:predicted AAA+ superfamily ATPase
MTMDTKPLDPRELHERMRQMALSERAVAALERLAPSPPPRPDFAGADAFVWQPAPEQFHPVAQVNRVRLDLLKAIAPMRDQLLANTQRFASGYPANNALLWGARGMGKSSLIKAVHAAVLETMASTAHAAKDGEPSGLKLVEIHREDIASLPRCLAHLRGTPFRFIVLCDDLSFDDGDASYKSLKAVLDGGIEGRPANVLFYATSNRRHLLARDMMENERSTAINPAEAVEEKVSLSDRFGLWIGFHHCSQDAFMEMVRGYAQHYQLPIDDAALAARAKAWSMTRGARSGRVAWQFIQDLAGELGVRLD